MDKKPLKLTATRVDHYVSKKGNITFRYIVTGDDDSLLAYEEAQGANFRTFNDEGNASNPMNGKPLWFTTQALAKNVDLAITTNGNVIPKVDTDVVAEKVLDMEHLVNLELAKLQAQRRFSRNAVTAG